jgi:hypothetical protein
MLFQQLQNFGLKMLLLLLSGKTTMAVMGDDYESLSSMDDPKPPDPFVISRSRKMNPRVTLNIGGEHHDVMWATLEKIPRYKSCKGVFLYFMSQNVSSF